jgi:toxin ParE1/3/4
MNFILAPSATRDLDRLSQYFLEANVEAGERLFKALNQRFYQLTQFPNLGKTYPQLDPTIRGLLVEKQIIFYRVTPTEVEIVRIVDGRQDLTQLFTNEDLN